MSKRGGTLKRRWPFLEVWIVLSFQAVQSLFHETPLLFRRQARIDTKLYTKTKDNSGANKRVNGRVREIIEILQSRTEPLTGSKINIKQKPGPEWTKTRRYLYHRRDLTPSQVIKVLDFLQSTLQEDRALVASVIQPNPRILRFSVDKYLEPTAVFLKKLYGDDLFLEAVRRNPGLLLSRGVGCDAPEESIASIENLFASSLGLKQSDLKLLKEDAPWLFQRSLHYTKSIIDYWSSILQHNGKSAFSNRRSIAKLLKSYPTLFNLSIDKGIKPKIEFLEEECGLSKADIASLLIGHRAAVFCLSVEDNLRPSVNFLKEELLTGKDEEETSKRLKKCMIAHPNILSVSKFNLREKISYFDQIDFMCASRPKKSLASRVALRSPTVYSLSLQDNIMPKVAFLAGVWGAKAPAATMENETNTGACLGTLLAETPSILTMSLEGNLQPTLNFYNRTGFTFLDETWKLRNCYVAGEEAVSWSTKSVPIVRPRYIASSLFQRLLPRWHYYLMNKDRYSTLVDDMKKPPLHILAGGSDATFSNFLQIKVEDFRAFKEEAVPRLKFSSQFDTWLKTGRPIE